MAPGEAVPLAEASSCRSSRASMTAFVRSYAVVIGDNLRSLFLGFRRPIEAEEATIATWICALPSSR
jgi:hypothetical protein